MDKRIEGVRERMEKATDGLVLEGCGQEGYANICPAGYSPIAEEVDRPDAELWVSAKSDLSYLLKRVEESEAKLKLAREALEYVIFEDEATDGLTSYCRDVVEKAIGEIGGGE